jgi:hypothetical protein
VKSVHRKGRKGRKEKKKKEKKKTKGIREGVAEWRDRDPLAGSISP